MSWHSLHKLKRLDVQKNPVRFNNEHREEHLAKTTNDLIDEILKKMENALAKQAMLKKHKFRSGLHGVWGQPGRK